MRWVFKTDDKEKTASQKALLAVFG